MKILISNFTEPRFNLATEEYILKKTTENIIFLYRNSPSVIVGKHQNAMGEVNYRFITENNIPLIRRISGGGTVYHDEGNINFTFIRNGEEGHLVNFRMFIEPIAEFLKQLDIPAEIGVRNDILVNGLKVSGNAEHIYKKRTLHHGTLLYSSNLDNLRGALKIEPGRYTDRAVKSVRSSVSNLQPFISENFTTDQFFNKLSEFLIQKFQLDSYSLDPSALNEIGENAKTKYTDWNWNFGYSPDYTFLNKLETTSGEFTINMQVEKGIITKSLFQVRGIADPFPEIQALLDNQPHTFQTFASPLLAQKFSSKIKNFNPEIIWYFF